jgi:hypothetical protein
MSQNLSKPRIKLPHLVIVKAPGLLPMLYMVRELADELSMPERTLRDWLLHGAPHTRDRLGHIWINGQAFAAWVLSQRRKAPGSRLKTRRGILHGLQPDRDGASPDPSPVGWQVGLHTRSLPALQRKSLSGSAA